MTLYSSPYLTDTIPGGFSNHQSEVLPHPGKTAGKSNNHWYSMLEQDVLLIDDLMRSYGPFTPGCAMVGVCEDGIPFLLDLNNPDIGSILVTGERRCGKTALLKFILASASLMNDPIQVTYQVITEDPRQYHPFTHQAHCNGIFQSRKAETTRLIDSLLQLADRRQHQPGEGPTQLLVIDDLADFIHGLDNETYWGFEWLVRFGSRRRIWVIASQTLVSMSWLDSELLDAFSTHIWGNDPGTGVDTQPAQKVLPVQKTGGHPELPASFHVPYKDSWLTIATRKITPG